MDHATRQKRRCAPWWIALVALGCAADPPPPKPLSGDGRRPDVSALVEPHPDVSRRDLFHGPGGPDLAPPASSPFRFERRDESGMSSNLEVTDVHGVRWDAKLGHEARTEVVVSRLLWAVGYHQPPVYYVPAWNLADGPSPGPQPPARFRPEVPEWKRIGEWAWKDNPFVGTRELRGLVVMMAIVNNWDLKTSNNAIYPARSRSAAPRYVVKDLGQSLGSSARLVLGTNDDAGDFAREDLIREVEGDRVRLVFDPLPLNWGIARDVTVEDVVWICERLAALSDRQWRDAFRAGGYDEQEAAPFIAHLERKVAEGMALARHARP